MKSESLGEVKDAMEVLEKAKKRGGPYSKEEKDIMAYIENTVSYLRGKTLSDIRWASFSGLDKKTKRLEELINSKNIGNTESVRDFMPQIAQEHYMKRRGEAWKNDGPATKRAVKGLFGKMGKLFKY